MGGILNADMQRVVREQRLGFVATVNQDGSPNLSPKGTTTVWDDDHLVFADLRSPQTIANLRVNPLVEINVVDPIRRRGYRFRASARVIDRGAELEQAIAFFSRGDQAVTRAGERIRAVVLIAVDRALPLTSPAYDLGLTEDDVVRRWLAYHESLWAGTPRESGPAAGPWTPVDSHDGGADG
jgi:predicted pyridoxine 5'-phosphate oxidase superfamily flavin-nucleotide-binding protein